MMLCDMLHAGDGDTKGYLRAAEGSMDSIFILDLDKLTFEEVPTKDKCDELKGRALMQSVVFGHTIDFFGGVTNVKDWEQKLIDLPPSKSEYNFASSIITANNHLIAYNTGSPSHCPHDINLFA